MFFDENLVLELRLNLLDKYVDYFVIVESKYNHKGEAKKLNFDINNFKKFKDKRLFCGEYNFSTNTLTQLFINTSGS